MFKNERTTWNVPVSRVLDEALEKAVELDTHSAKADFIRDAVRRRLEDVGFKAQPFKEVTTQRARILLKTCS